MNSPLESDIPSDVSDDSQARAYPGRVRGQRLEITTADLTMYSMITGRAPSKEERKRALTWSENDPVHHQLAGAVDLSPSALDLLAGERLLRRGVLAAGDAHCVPLHGQVLIHLVEVGVVSENGK